MDEQGYSITFQDSAFRIVRADSVIGSGFLRNADGLYFLHARAVTRPEGEINQVKQVGADQWHRRFGHVSFRSLQDVSLVVEGLDLDKTMPPCQTCAATASKNKPLAKSIPQQYRASRVLARICVDLKGPLIRSVHGYLYFLVIVDEYSRFVVVRLLKNKSDAFQQLSEFVLWAENQTEKKTQVLCCDNGEMVSNRSKAWAASKGIHMDLTTPGKSAQNGVAESAIRAVDGMSRAMLAQSGFRDSFWEYSVVVAAYLKNLCLNRGSSHSVTPFEVFLGHRPSVRHLRVFGCVGYVRRSNYKKKDVFRAVRARLVGYDVKIKSYLMLDANGVVHRSRDVQFFEKDFSWSQETSAPESVHVDLDFSDAGAEQEDAGAELKRPEKETAQPVVQLRRSLRKNKGVPAADATHDLLHEIGDQKASQEVNGVWKQPLTIEKALGGADAEFWRPAVLSELKSLSDSGTWEVQQLPSGIKPIGCRWVLTVKGDGSPKARLVAQGFSQKYGVDFQDTFSPTIKYECVRILIAISASLGLDVTQMDVSTAFLNANLEETVFMKIPPGMEIIGDDSDDLVLRLRRALYGLKQSPRAWNRELDTFLKSQGFLQSTAEPCIYIKRSNDGFVSGAFCR